MSRGRPHIRLVDDFRVLRAWPPSTFAGIRVWPSAETAVLINQRDTSSAPGTVTGLGRPDAPGRDIPLSHEIRDVRACRPVDSDRTEGRPRLTGL